MQQGCVFFIFIFLLGGFYFFTDIISYFSLSLSLPLPALFSNTSCVIVTLSVKQKRGRVMRQIGGKYRRGAHMTHSVFEG